MSAVHVIKKCPVCEMVVRKSVFALKYVGIDYQFCSEQCLRKFKQRPHLFVGSPLHGKSEKQKGHKSKKARKIKLKTPMSATSVALVASQIRALMGVESLEVNSDEIFVVYDLFQVSLEDIENVIIRSQGYLKETITDKVRRGIIHYSEDCELDNLAHLTKGGGCH